MKKLLKKLCTIIAALIVIFGSGMMQTVHAESTNVSGEQTDVLTEANVDEVEGEGEVVDPTEEGPTDQVIYDGVIAALDAMKAPAGSWDPLLESVKAEDFVALKVKVATITNEELKKTAEDKVVAVEHAFKVQHSDANKSLKKYYAELPLFFDESGRLKDGVFTTEDYYGYAEGLKHLGLLEYGVDIIELKGTELKQISEWLSSAYYQMLARDDASVLVSVNLVNKTYILGRVKAVSMTQTEVRAFLNKDGKGQAKQLNVQAGSYDETSANPIIPEVSIITNREMVNVGKHKIIVKQTGVVARGVTEGDVEIAIDLTTTADKKTDKKKDPVLAKTGVRTTEAIVGGASLFGIALLAVLKRK